MKPTYKKMGPGTVAGTHVNTISFFLSDQAGAQHFPVVQAGFDEYLVHT